MDNVKCIISQTPFDVLGAAEMCFDLSAQAREAQNLLIRQRWAVLLLRLNLQTRMDKGSEHRKRRLIFGHSRKNVQIINRRFRFLIT